MSTVAVKRKLIDLNGPVFDALSVRAREKGVSLKKYIETLLEEDAIRHRPSIPDSVSDTRIVNLVGIARHVVQDADPNDERLQYILSK